ncbi:MAG: glycosyltransferase, partial [Nitrospiria bacterium]
MNADATAGGVMNSGRYSDALKRSASHAVNEGSMRFVSIIIPCRNERDFIASCLDSILGNDYPFRLIEILVVDGMSTDGTRGIVEAYAQHHTFIRLLDNPKKLTPAALNVGVKNAMGEIIIRMDAHATYDSKYISKCTKALDEYKAGNVGGIWRIIPRGNTLTGKAIVKSLSHRFGP